MRPSTTLVYVTLSLFLRNSVTVNHIENYAQGVLSLKTADDASSFENLRKLLDIPFRP